MENNQPLNNGVTEHQFDAMQIVQQYLRYWKWFLLGVFLCLTIAFVYFRYTIPQYKAVASILVKDDKKGAVASEMSAFADLGLLKGVKNNVDNEIEILKSRTLIQSTVKKLGLGISYWSKGRVRSFEAYNSAPIEIVFSKMVEGFSEKSFTYHVQGLTNSKFNLFNFENVKIGDYNYGDVIRLKEGNCVIFKKEPFFKNEDFEITIKINAIDNLVQSFKGRLSVVPLSKTTSIAELSIVDPTPLKAEQFLDTLIATYNQDAINDKNFISENTSKFIDQRLEYITNELGGVEKETETFKKENRVTDIVTEAGLFINNASDFQKNEIEIETQLRVVKLMTDFVNKSNIADLIPANVLSSDTQASGLIGQYNELILERNRILKNAGPDNAVVIALDAKIGALKENVKSSLNQQKKALEISRNDLARQNALVSGKISQIPTLERESRELGRQQQIKETLYLYLLQKREETAISLAVTEPNAKVIDPARASDIPVSPKKSIILLAAVLLGLLIPFGIIYLIDLFDTKIKSQHDLEGKLSIPFLGDVPKSSSENELIHSDSRSSTAEALRIVRTNLEFLLTNVTQGNSKTIFVTSTIPKEGKTFIAVNLASTIAFSGKKVLLIGLDIRNPKIDHYINLPEKGITNYLLQNNQKIQDYIVKIDGYPDFSILPSGVIPPNPVDLLMNNNKVDDLFAELKKEYDYIIVDTAPVSLVTDTMLIAKNADAFVYVMRANYLEKGLLRYPESLYIQCKLPNMSVLLNDTEIHKTYGYGYGYGYGIEEEKSPWYQSIYKKIFTKN